MCGSKIGKVSRVPSEKTGAGRVSSPIFSSMVSIASRLDESLHHSLPLALPQKRLATSGENASLHWQGCLKTTCPNSFLVVGQAVNRCAHLHSSSGMALQSSTTILRILGGRLSFHFQKLFGPILVSDASEGAILTSSSNSILSIGGTLDLVVPNAAFLHDLVGDGIMVVTSMYHARSSRGSGREWIVLWTMSRTCLIMAGEYEGMRRTMRLLRIKHHSAFTFFLVIENNFSNKGGSQWLTHRVLIVSMALASRAWALPLSTSSTVCLALIEGGSSLDRRWLQ